MKEEKEKTQITETLVTQIKELVIDLENQSLRCFVMVADFQAQKSLTVISEQEQSLTAMLVAMELGATGIAPKLLTDSINYGREIFKATLIGRTPSDPTNTDTEENIAEIKKSIHRQIRNFAMRWLKKTGSENVMNSLEGLDFIENSYRKLSQEERRHIIKTEFLKEMQIEIEKQF